MREEYIQPSTPHLIPITSDMIDKHLLYKQNYLDTWNELLDRWLFTKKEFCDLINRVRTLRIQKQEVIKRKIQDIESKTLLSPEEKKKLKDLKDTKNTIMRETINEIFNPVIQYKIIGSDIAPARVYGLIGSVLHIQQQEKREIKEYIEMAKTDLSTVLIDDKNYRYVEEILHNIEDIEAEYFKDNNIGGELNEYEKKIFSEQVIDSFKHTHEADIQQGKIDMLKITEYLHHQHLI